MSEGISQAVPVVPDPLCKTSIDNCEQLQQNDQPHIVSDENKVVEGILIDLSDNPQIEDDQTRLMKMFLDYEQKLQPTDYIKAFYTIRHTQEIRYRNCPEFSCQVASSPTHFMRNRYRDILPYDFNRVVVETVDKGDNPDGYINASHIQLEGGQTKFIAAQAPLPSTVDEWWQMIEEKNITLIVMLCKLVEMSKVKCERYWPDSLNKKEMYGDFEITVTNEEKFEGDDEYILRTFLVENPETGTSKTIYQLHYREWPDHGCPTGEHQLLRMVEKMNDLHKDKTAPVLVHCSAGVGRTGTIIAVNYIRECMETKSLTGLDLFELVLTLRRQRSSMVQTQDQFQFVHKCVAHYCKERLGLPIPQPPPKPSNGGISPPVCDAPAPTPSVESDSDGEEIPDYPNEPVNPRGPEEVPS